MNNQNFFWTDEQEEQKSIIDSVFTTTLYELLVMVEEGIKNGAKKEDFFGEPEVKRKKNEIILIKKDRGKVRKIIDSKLKISEVIKFYGLKIHKGNKIICPFHNDTDPSLSFSDDKNCFYCFGCNAKGDIIELVRRLEEWKEKRL